MEIGILSRNSVISRRMEPWTSGVPVRGFMFPCSKVDGVDRVLIGNLMTLDGPRSILWTLRCAMFSFPPDSGISRFLSVMLSKNTNFYFRQSCCSAAIYHVLSCMNAFSRYRREMIGVRFTGGGVHQVIKFSFERFGPGDMTFSGELLT
jgi:hypothetical protein